MPLLKGQADVSGQVPMPTDRVDDTSVVTDVAAETVTWFYNNSGSWASATGQAAGTIVWGKTVYSGILNSAKVALGSFNDTSVVLAAATRLSQQVSAPEDILSKLQFLAPADQEAMIADYLPTAGDYIIDHRRSQIWANQKDTVADDALAYSYASTLSGGGTGDKVDLIKVGGTAISLGQTTASASLPVVLASDQDLNVDINSVDTGGLIGMKTGQNGDFDVAYTAATQITVSNLPFYVASLYNEDIVSITQIDINGTVLATYTRDDAQMAIAANVITVTGASFGATDTFIVYTNIPRSPIQTILDDASFTAGSEIVTPVSGFYDSTESEVTDGRTGAFGMTAKRRMKVRDEAFDTGTGSNKEFEINPLSDHHEESTLAAVTNGTDATYAYYVDMDGYRNFALQTTLSGGSGTCTMTVEATLQDDGTAAASCTYVDVTTALFGAASYTASGYHAVDTPVPIKYLKVKIVASTGGANDADWTLYFKKQY